MITASAFTARWIEANGQIKPSEHSRLGGLAVRRLQERFANGRAVNQLDFTDLCEMIEDAMGAKQ